MFCMEPNASGNVFFSISASFFIPLNVLLYRGHRELHAVSAAIQALLSPPASVAAALKGIQKTLGKALPFKVGKSCVTTCGF